MTAFIFKTRSEQRLEWLESERSKRQLTDDEWRELSRCEHAIYERERRRRVAA